MECISFCLNGKMAHFRKYYSNSTALSYMVPPVTTIKGIIAGLLGFERDSYYDWFANEKCKVSIIIETPLKKTTQTMNLLKVECLNDLNGFGKNRTQNNTEFVIPVDIRTGLVQYRIIFWHKDADVLNDLRKCICLGENYYYSRGICTYLGSAQCLGWISDGRIIQLTQATYKSHAIGINSVIVKDYIEKIEIHEGQNLSILKEETFTEFDKNRLITEDSKKDIIINTTNEPIWVQLKDNIHYYKTEDKNILFVE